MTKLIDKTFHGEFSVVVIIEMCLIYCVIIFDVSFDFFFFQAEDGIRDRNVTGVQTCALPIFLSVDFCCDIANSARLRIRKSSSSVALKLCAWRKNAVICASACSISFSLVTEM